MFVVSFSIGNMNGRRKGRERGTDHTDIPVPLPASILGLGQQVHVTSIESHSAGISLEWY